MRLRCTLSTRCIMSGVTAIVRVRFGILGSSYRYMETFFPNRAQKSSNFLKWTKYIGPRSLEFSHWLNKETKQILTERQKHSIMCIAGGMGFPAPSSTSRFNNLRTLNRIIQTQPKKTQLKQPLKLLSLHVFASAPPNPSEPLNPRPAGD